MEQIDQGESDDGVTALFELWCCLAIVVLHLDVELLTAHTEMEADDDGSILIHFHRIVAAAVLATVGADEELSGEHGIPDDVGR